MKLKRIIALVVCIMMALASIASATTVSEMGGYYVVDTPPVKADVEARAVSVTPVSVEKIGIEDAATLGINRGLPFVPATYLTDENTDCYKLTMQVNNIGDLYEAFDMSTGSKKKVKMFNISIKIPGLTSKQVVTSSTFEGKTWSAGGDGLQLTYGANGDEAYPYQNPAPATGFCVSNPVVSVVAVYAVEKGYTLDVTPTVKVTYAINGVEDTADADGVGTANVVFAEPEEGIAPVEAVAAKAQGAALTDLNGDSVTLDADYGIAKFDTPINTGLNKYYIVAKTATETSPDFLVDFSGAVEAEGNIAFYAIVKSTHGPITSLTLKAVANE